jgi:hypothetical protein
MAEVSAPVQASAAASTAFTPSASARDAGGAAAAADAIEKRLGG